MKIPTFEKLNRLTEIKSVWAVGFIKISDFVKSTENSESISVLVVQKVI